MASLSSEDSVSISDVIAVDSQEVGGATRTSESGHDRTVATNKLEKADDISVNEVGSRGQSSDIGAATADERVRDIEQTAESAATANSAVAMSSGDGTPMGGANSVTMEMTSSDPNEPPVSIISDNLGGGDESSAAANSVHYSPHKKKKLSDTLDRIRTTLYGSGTRLPATGGKRRSHTVLSRHVSLRVPPSHDESAHNLLRSQKLSGSISMFQLHADMAAEMTESLPPSKLQGSTKP